MEHKDLAEVIEDKVATRQDVKYLRQALKQDIKDVHTELKQDISDVRTELKQNIQSSESRVLAKLGGLITLDTVVLGILISVHH